MVPENSVAAFTVIVRCTPLRSSVPPSIRGVTATLVGLEVMFPVIVKMPVFAPFVVAALFPLTIVCEL